MSDLIRAVRVNEEIKHILDASREISIVALNAFLTARQAGTRSLGFSVVSRELRALAGKFETAMIALDDIISTLAADLAQSIRDRRQLGYIEAAIAQPDSHACLVPTLARAVTHHENIELAVAGGWLRLEDDIGRVLKLAETGGVLARSAKIEAAYGGDMARVLTQVAGQIETAIGEIVTRLGEIRAMTEGRT